MTPEGRNRLAARVILLGLGVMLAAYVAVAVVR